MADQSKLPAEINQGEVDSPGGKNKKDKKGKKDKKDKKKKGADGTDDDDDDTGVLSIILITLFIVLIWIAILGLLVKLDVGGFGSNVMTPLLKDVPVVNQILPGYPFSVSDNTVSGDGVINGGYDDLETAVNRIKELESQLAKSEEESNNSRKTISELQNEVKRLQTFENNQVAFEKIKDEFYEEVVFNDRAPDISEYRKYYEEIDPTNAQILYKQVVQQEHTDAEVEEYAKAYSGMKAKEAAGIFNTMTGDLDLVAKILGAMNTDSRGAILGAMDPEVAANVTKIMEPDDSVGGSAQTWTAPVPEPVSSNSSGTGGQQDDGEDEEAEEVNPQDFDNVG
ncbi:MAG: hypothetical protein K5989_11785 [Lachnospiraceae bacterium]|nr:hypothetical protein [Lachnospiraceae bacterium]